MMPGETVILPVKLRCFALILVVLL